MDFERSEVNLREDMAAKNKYLMRKYKDYTRFIGNKYKEEEKEDEDDEDDEGVYVKYVQMYWLLKNYLIDQYEPILEFVRIYFDSPTFDRIKKDKSAKIVDMLSAIGGTMGLLTGFSIISAVEIIFYLAKFFRFCPFKFKYILK